MPKNGIRNEVRGLRGWALSSAFINSARGSLQQRRLRGNVCLGLVGFSLDPC